MQGQNDDILTRSQHFTGRSRSSVSFVTTNDVESLLALVVPESVQTKYLALLFVNVVTAMETYLSDKFVQNVLNNSDLLKTFVETNADFKLQKVPLSDVLKIAAEIKAKTQRFV